MLHQLIRSCAGHKEQASACRKKSIDTESSQTLKEMFIYDCMHSPASYQSEHYSIILCERLRYQLKDSPRDLMGSPSQLHAQTAQDYSDGYIHYGLVYFR